MSNTLPSPTPAPAAVDRLKGEGFTIIETNSVPEPLWPVTLLRFDKREHELRVLRQQAVLDTLYQVERSAVPFPDDPPPRCAAAPARPRSPTR